jgi:hypothetical protein
MNYNPKSKLEIHQMINSMDLVDVWRDKNPGVRRYTWRETRHTYEY